MRRNVRNTLTAVTSALVLTGCASSNQESAPTSPFSVPSATAEASVPYNCSPQARELQSVTADMLKKDGITPAVQRVAEAIEACRKGAPEANKVTDKGSQGVVLATKEDDRGLFFRVGRGSDNALQEVGVIVKSNRYRNDATLEDLQMNLLLPDPTHPHHPAQWNTFENNYSVSPSVETAVMRDAASTDRNTQVIMHSPNVLESEASRNSDTILQIHAAAINRLGSLLMNGASAPLLDQIKPIFTN